METKRSRPRLTLARFSLVHDLYICTVPPGHFGGCRNTVTVKDFLSLTWAGYGDWNAEWGYSMEPAMLPINAKVTHLTS